MRLHGIELNQGAVIRNANIQRGSILPNSETTEGQLFFNVEADTLYVRNADNTQWNAIGNYTLSDITDVEVSGAEHGQALIYDEVSEKWKPGAGGGGTGATFLNELSDVDISETTVNGNVLGYDEASGNWIGINSSGSVSVITDNIGVDGTFTHNDGNGTSVTISLNSQDLPFNDESVDDPVLVSDNVGDAINEVKDLVISKQAISTMVDNMATSGTIAHNDGQGTGIVIDLNSDSIPFESGYSPSEIEADNVRDALDEIHQLAASLFIYEDTTFYIDSTGDDVTGDGTEDNPWGSPHRAFDFLNDKILGEGALITIEVAEGDYEFDAPMVIRHSQGSQIQLIGAPLLGNKPQGFKLPDYTDPLNPIQEPREPDEFYTSIAVLGLDEDDAVRQTFADADMVNNTALLHERFATRFLFRKSGEGVGCVKIEDGCGISLIDNILFEGEWEGDTGYWDSDSVFDLTNGAFAKIGESVAAISFPVRVCNVSNAFLEWANPVILNVYSFGNIDNGGELKLVANGNSSNFSDDAIIGGIFYSGRRNSNFNVTNNSTLYIWKGCFIGGIDVFNDVIVRKHSIATVGNSCFVGIKMYNHSKIGLVEAVEHAKLSFYTYNTFFGGISAQSSNPFLIRAEDSDMTYQDVGRSDTIVKGCRPRFVYATSNSYVRLFYPQCTNNDSVDIFAYHTSTINFFGTTKIDDTNTNMSATVEQGSRIVIDEPGTGDISSNLILNTTYGVLSKDGSYIGKENINSLHKKWQIVETDMTVVEGDRMLVNADSADITITLPSSPKDSDEVIFRMIRNNDGANAFLINPGAETINDVAGVSNVGDVLHRDLTLVYHTYGWWATGGNVDGGTY